MGQLILSVADADFKEAYVGGLFVIDCLEIKLVQNDVENPKIYKSIGCLHVGPENGVEARLIIPRDQESARDLLADFRHALNTKSGTLIPESHYYKLEARDVSQNIWTNSSVAVEIDNQSDAMILTLNCADLRMESRIEVFRYFTHMVFLDALNFPKNVVHQQSVLERSEKKMTLSSSSSAGELGELLVTFNPREDKAGAKFAELYSESQRGITPPIHFQERLLEAVRFCTATLATPVMSETVHGNVRTIELSKARPLNAGLIEEPLEPRGNNGDFYTLMACYYKYACANAVGREYAPLSAKLGGLFTLKGVWIDTIALLVTVAVESLLGDELFKKLGKPNKGLVAEIEKLFSWVKNAAIDGKLIERALSALGSMKSNRAADKLFALVDAGAIYEADRKAWVRLRNPAAHGSFEIDPLELQTLLDDIYRLSTLIYKLVFIIIGYSGKYSDRSTHGWPIEVFDLSTYLANIEANKIAKAMP